MSNGFQKNFWLGRISGPVRPSGGYHDGVRVARPRRRARRFNDLSTVSLERQSWGAPTAGRRSLDHHTDTVTPQPLVRSLIGQGGGSSVIQSPQFLQAITSGEREWGGLSIPPRPAPRRGASGAPPLADLAASTAPDLARAIHRPTAPSGPLQTPSETVQNCSGSATPPPRSGSEPTPPVRRDSLPYIANPIIAQFSVLRWITLTR